MRVTFLLPAIDLSGGVKVVATYARMLSERGHEVNVVYPQRPLTRSPRSWASRLRGAWRQRARAQRGHFADCAHLLRALPVDRGGDRAVTGGLAPVKVQAVPDADVIIATYWETAHWIARYPVSKGKPFYLIQHYETWDCDNEALARMRASWTLPLQKLVVARWLRELAQREFGDENAVLLHNGVDLEHFKAPQRRMNDTPVVGYTYSWAPWKRSDLIAAAVNRTRLEAPALRVRTFGQYPPAPRMPYPPGGEHVFQPKQARIPSLYAAADVWVLGSDSEGFGLPALEAMACRTPVVSTMCDGAIDIVEGSAGGMLVPTNDAEALAAAILDVVQERDGWGARSAAARERAECFRWDKACDALEATLRGEPTEFDATRQR